MLGELIFGAKNSSRVEENLEKIEKLTNRSLIRLIDERTSYFYGEIKRKLRSMGTPIPENEFCLQPQQFSMILL